MLGYSLAKIVHILAATLWFAYPLGQGRAVKLSLQLPSPTLKRATEELLRRTRICVYAGIATGISGAILIQLQGGLGNAAPQIQWGIGLFLGLMLLNIWGLLPAAQQLDAREDQGERDISSLPVQLRKYHMMAGVFHLGWLTLLALMILR